MRSQKLCIYLGVTRSPEPSTQEGKPRAFAGRLGDGKASSFSRLFAAKPAPFMAPTTKPLSGNPVLWSAFPQYRKKGHEHPGYIPSVFAPVFVISFRYWGFTYGIDQNS
ncbi:ribose import ATP-binding protein RbsA 1 [Striga asiatica]|uniref:Ribose import ATP-binding protein RbsA 1 n=1 Tax=Striga asiatica TaxID=4170 RepID=A0A5A7PZS3_STRAF|nr:ribose import ATP-binding protein RbsA 1 [Striga asiatica]